MSQAVLRTHRALLSGEKIAVYGDFDADGITSTAVLVQALRKLGANVIPYIPNRATEGYGMSTAALERLREQDVDLIITCDTGVTAAREVESASSMGMEVIITDHHVPVGSLPRACAVVNPKRADSQYPLKDLAGVGVAYKFLQALLQDRKRDDILKNSLDLVAIGSITDMVSLVGENRWWVKQGLTLINNTPRLGLQELLRVSNLQPGNLSEGNISWMIGPRINAAGRVDNANTSYQLLITDDAEEAAFLAAELDRKNAERVQQTQSLLAKAEEKIISAGCERPILFACGEDFHSGVMGLVAGRLSERFCRPVILVKIGKETCRGSGRSIREFDIINALSQCQDLLTRFGGHTRAAGLNLDIKDLPEFQERMLALAGQGLEGLDLKPHIDIDAEIQLGSIQRRLYDNIIRLAPFGMGNPEPVFLTRMAEVVDARQMGSKGEHLRLKLKQRSGTWDAVGWNMGNCYSDVEQYMDVVFTLELNRWNGDEYLRLNLVDLSPAE
jgi:single-stranded-DNA-specific exonuclease